MGKALIIGAVVMGVVLGAAVPAFAGETTATPVIVVDPVEVTGTVPVTGTVEVKQPVEVTGTVRLADSAVASVTGSVSIDRLEGPLLSSLRRLAAFCAFMSGFAGGFAWVRFRSR